MCKNKFDMFSKGLFSFVVPLCFDFPSFLFLQRLTFFLPSECISLLMFAFFHSVNNALVLI